MADRLDKYRDENGQLPEGLRKYEGMTDKDWDFMEKLLAAADKSGPKKKYSALARVFAQAIKDKTGKN